MTEQQIPPAPTSPPPATPPPAAEKRPPWGSPEEFDPDKAWKMIQDLRAEKSTHVMLKQELEAQRGALAAAFGVKPEETSDADKIAQQIESLRSQILTSEKRALAAEFKIPEQYQHMLTASDADSLRKQATDLVEFAQAAHHAAISSAPTPPAPAFQPNPGQGQGNTPLTPGAQAAAEYEKFYPSTPPRA